MTVVLFCALHGECAHSEMSGKINFIDFMSSNGNRQTNKFERTTLGAIVTFNVLCLLNQTSFNCFCYSLSTSGRIVKKENWNGQNQILVHSFSCFFFFLNFYNYPNGEEKEETERKKERKVCEFSFVQTVACGNTPLLACRLVV